MRRGTWTWATEGDRGYGKLGDGKRTEKATAKSGVVEERVASRVWVGVVKRFAFALVRDGGRRKEKREERTWTVEGLKG